MTAVSSPALAVLAQTDRLGSAVSAPQPALDTLCTLTITFQPPERQNRDASVLSPTAVHQRRVEGLPLSLAWSVCADRMRYLAARRGYSPGAAPAAAAADASPPVRYRLYRYQKAGTPRILALDFGEVYSLDVRRTAAPR